MLNIAWAAASRPVVRDASMATWSARDSTNGSGQTPLLDLSLLREEETWEEEGPGWNSAAVSSSSVDDVDIWE